MTYGFQVVTLFPELVMPYVGGSILGRAVDSKRIAVDAINPREFTQDRHRTVDDAPYGGGAGMVMMAEPLAQAIDRARERAPDTHVVLLTPAGKPFDQSMAKRFAGLKGLTLVCGRYEGIDQRIADHMVEEEVSLGDFVLTGGELAALAIVDATSRLLEGVLGHSEGAVEESFTDAPLLEHPQYTRPRVWREHEVPEVLLSGNHAKIQDWRLKAREDLTASRRPDLLAPESKPPTPTK
jgi:tRNA (guanine37-N1)-methyltransferase